MKIISFKRIFYIIFLSCPFLLKAQKQTETLSQQELEKIIIKIDTDLFNAYNTCNIQDFKKHFTDDLEFYHDKGGLTKTLSAMITGFENGLCKTDSKWRTRRELVEGSLKVFPLNKYGAILVGEHRFYEREIGGSERLASTAKFTHVFEEKDGIWKISRVLSYDHQIPK